MGIRASAASDNATRSRPGSVKAMEAPSGETSDTRLPRLTSGTGSGNVTAFSASRRMTAEAGRQRGWGVVGRCDSLHVRDDGAVGSVSTRWTFKASRSRLMLAGVICGQADRELGALTIGIRD